MKRNIINLSASLCLMVLATLFSCQQEDMLERKTDGNPIVSRGTGNKVTWTIDTTERNGAGHLDSLLTVEETQKGLTRDAVTDLILLGPINESDLSVVARMQYLDSLSLEKVKIIDNEGKESKIFPSFLRIQSEMGISLPTSITDIKKEAFLYGKFRYCHIPDNVTNIQESAFSNCQSLETVVLPKNLITISQNTFYNCRGLTGTIQIPSTIREIGPRAFYYCSSLEGVIFPDNLIKIGERAFHECNNLGEISLPPNLREIGAYAFWACHNLELNGDGFPSSIKKIDSWAFAQCRSLTNIKNIPAGIEIGNVAFADIGITELTVTKDMPLVREMFRTNGKLKKVKFEEGITSIPYQFLSDCPLLESVALPSTLTDIEDYCFSGCTSLTNITLPANLERLGSYVFHNCSLTEIKLGEKLKKVGGFAFQYCNNLATLIIPASVDECGDGIVYRCDNLTAVFWNSKLKVPRLYKPDSALLYLTEGVASDEYNKNIIIDGICETLTIKVNSDGYYSNFHCPKEFVAQKIRYVRNFRDDYTQSSAGTSSRWQTLVLPFSPTSIKAKVGSEFSKVIAPFDAAVEGAKPFWLRELGENGFVDATQIEANKPYIIAMPYNDNYLSEYNINSDVEFSAQNVTIPVTETPGIYKGPEFSFIPTYSHIGQRADYLSINESRYYDSFTNKYYPSGSVFVSNRLIRPFEAYVTNNTGTRSFIAVSPSATTRSAKKVGKIPQKDDM